MRRALIGILTMTACAVLPASARALPVTFAGSSGALAASVTFNALGSNLVVTLANTANADVSAPADVLTGVFFDSSLDLSNLSRTSALVCPTCDVFYDPQGQPAGDVVGGEWVFATGISDAPGGQDYGISSSGLGIFGGSGGTSSTRFPGPNLAGPVGVDGLQYGILSAGDVTATGNMGVTGSKGLVKNSVVFTLSCPAGTTGCLSWFDTDTIGNVRFQYGTSLTEPGFGGSSGGSGAGGSGGAGSTAPEPATLALLGAAVAVGARRLRRK